MNAVKPTKGMRRLRVGEIMARGDIMPTSAFGTYDEIPERLIGARVLGIRSGFNDIVFRARKRSPNP